MQKPWPERVAFYRGSDGELIELLEDKIGYTYVVNACSLVAPSHLDLKVDPFSHIT